MKAIVRFLAAVLWLGGAQTAGAVVMGFDTLVEPGTGRIVIPSYQEDGFTLTKPNGFGFLYAQTGSTHTLGEWTGSGALAINGSNTRAVLSRVGGGAFDLLSIDLIELSSTWPGPRQVDFTGFLVGGGTVSNTFVLDDMWGFETFAFSGFTNVFEVRWIQSAGYHQFDNIVLEPHSVPMPGTLALVILGALLLRRCCRATPAWG